MKYALSVILASVVITSIASAQSSKKSYPGELDEEPLAVQKEVYTPQRTGVEWLQKRTLSSIEKKEKTKSDKSE